MSRRQRPQCPGVSGPSVPASAAPVSRRQWSQCPGVSGPSVPASAVPVSRRQRSQCPGVSGPSVPASAVPVSRRQRSQCPGVSGPSVPASVVPVSRRQRSQCPSPVSRHQCSPATAGPSVTGRQQSQCTRRQQKTPHKKSHRQSVRSDYRGVSGPSDSSDQAVPVVPAVSAARWPSAMWSLCSVAPGKPHSELVYSLLAELPTRHGPDALLGVLVVAMSLHCLCTVGALSGSFF